MANESEKQENKQEQDGLIDPVVMCTAQDAFEFFGAALVDCYEHYFAGGENEIAQISYNFQKAFEARLDKDGKYT